VVQDPNEVWRDTFVTTDMDRTSVESRRWKTEQSLKTRREDAGIPDVNIDLSLGSQIQERSKKIVGILQLPQNSLFEIPRTMDPRAFIEIDVLIEGEVEGVTPSELTVCPGVPDRKRSRRWLKQHRSDREKQNPGEAIHSIRLQKDKTRGREQPVTRRLHQTTLDESPQGNMES
jgi:hypothetical protein